MKSLSDKAGILIFANLFKYTLGFVVPMVLVRMLSQDEYGTYQQLILISTATIGVMTLGIPTSIFYYFTDSQSNRIPSLMIQTFSMLVVAGCIASLAIFFVASPIAERMNNASMAALLQIYAISFAFLIASEYSINLMIAQDRYKLAVTFELAESVARVFFLMAPLVFGFGFPGLILGLVLYALIRFFARTYYLFHGSGIKYSGWSKSIFPIEQLSYGIPLAIVALVWMVAGTFNKGILALSFTPKDFAIYTVGALEIPLDTIFQASVANVLRASLPPLVQAGELVEVVRIVRESVRKLSFIVLPSFIFLFGFSEQFITVLFTEQYAESVPVFRIYLWIMPLNMLMLSPIPQIFGKTRLNLYINLSSAGVLLVLSYVLLKLVGFYGPAVAMVSAHYFGAGIFILVVLRLTQSSFQNLFPLRSLFLVLVASLSGLLAAKFMPHLTSFGLLNLAVSGLLFCGAYFSACMMLGVFTQEDRTLAKRWLNKLLPVSRQS